jgi:hypothetical protein
MGAAKGSKDANQCRRLLSLAAVLDGMNRADAPWANEPTPRLSVTPKAQLADIVEAGPDREVDGVVRWRP